MNQVNFRTLDLNLLRIFDVVMAERSLTRAAQKLAQTQPAVSNAMRRLRDSCDRRHPTCSSESGDGPGFTFQLKERQASAGILASSCCARSIIFSAAFNFLRRRYTEAMHM